MQKTFIICKDKKNVVKYKGIEFLI